VDAVVVAAVTSVVYGCLEFHVRYSISSFSSHIFDMNFKDFFRVLDPERFSELPDLLHHGHGLQEVLQHPLQTGKVTLAALTAVETLMWVSN